MLKIDTLPFIISIMVFLLTTPSAVQSKELPTFHNGLTIRHELEGGRIVITTFYNTSYAEGQWKITDNKNVGIYLFVEKQPNNTIILVEHMHADVLIYSNRSEINGIKQDTMDDKLHTGNQLGFYVSPEYPYSCIFAIEGYTEFLLSIWGFMWGDFGWMSGTERRLTEDTLKYYGAKGNEFMIVFDLLIKHEGEEYYHTISFQDTFIVYFNGTFQENPGAKSEYKVKAIHPYQEHSWIGLVGFILAIIGGVGAFLKSEEKWDSQRSEYVRQPGFRIFLAVFIIGVILMIIGVACALYYYEIEVPVVSRGNGFG
jgi:uncharacterized membrane protein